jgi:hypothetical protein
MSEQPTNQLIIRDMALRDIGEVLSRSGFFSDSRDASKAIVKVLAGQELGVGPITAMTGIHIIQGQPTLSANLMAATIKRSGRYDYRIRELTNEICRLEFFEKTDEPKVSELGKGWESVGESVFTIEDARRARTQNLAKFARNMLFARAMSNGTKWFCPDCLGGTPVYTPAELGMDEIEESEPDVADNLTEVMAAEFDHPTTDINQELASEVQCKRLQHLAQELKMTPADVSVILKKRNVSRRADLTVEQADEIIRKLADILVARDKKQEAEKPPANP